MFDQFFERDGVKYPWRGPVNLYDEKNQPDIRSEVHVNYFNMADKVDRTSLANVLTGINNGRYASLMDPLYTVPDGGHQHVTVIYAEYYACDPAFQMPDPENEIGADKTEPPETEETLSSSDTSEEFSEEDPHVGEELPAQRIEMSRLKPRSEIQEFKGENP